MAKKQKRAAKRVAPKTRALVRRAPSIPSTGTKRAELVTDARTVPPDGSLQLGTWGLSTLALSKKEEAILAEPVNRADILIKPSGQPYVPHTVYTRWLNRAFGRTGWALVPNGKPIIGEGGKSVLCPYVLHIKGTPIAGAWGEQEYFAGNRDQTYGDAVEATYAYALRRCMKHLGVGLELWDRAFLDAFVDAECVQVTVRKKNGETSQVWRRAKDPKFWNEVSGREARGMESAPSQRVEAPRYDRERSPAPSYGSNRDSGEKITQGQRRRLWVIIRNSGRSEDLEVRPWLKRRFGIESTKEITRRDYNFVCEAIESRAPLPELAAREPGED